MEDKTQNEIIKEVCERWGVSQIRLAEKLGVSNEFSFINKAKNIYNSNCKSCIKKIQTRE